MADIDTVHSLKAQIVGMTSEHVNKLYTMWERMFEPHERENFLRRLHTHAQNFYTDLINESHEKEDVIKAEITALRTEAGEISRLLNKDIVLGDMPEGTPLVSWQQTLDSSLADLRNQLRERRAEICELLLQQDQLCEELGNLPLPLIADPLPKAEEIENFRQHLQRLQEERKRRLDELYQLRQQIKQDMKLLELLPHTDTDERLLNQPNPSLTPETFEALRELKKHYHEQYCIMHDRIDSMRRNIELLWQRLKYDDKKAMRLVNQAREYSQRTFDVLTIELQRCQELRRQNLKPFIENLRVEIKKYWDLTLKSEQERKRFTNFHNNWYNEDLLDLHELELEDLKTYYTENKEIFDLYASRAELWTRMEALESKASDPNRYNNRGGQLLKEERERKAITSKLPKIEQQITELVREYEKRHDEDFKVYGENILDRIAAGWERRRQEKEQHISARKQGGTTPTHAPPMLSATTIKTRTSRTLRNTSASSSSTVSLRNAASHMQLNSVGARPQQQAMTTGHKRKLQSSNLKQLATPQAKRSLFNTLNAMPAGSSGLRLPMARGLLASKKTTKSPLKKVRVLAHTMRRSSGLNGRRSFGATNNLRSKRTKVSVPSVRIEPPSGSESEYVIDENNAEAAGDDTYVTFEKCIEPEARSSILPAGRVARHGRHGRKLAKINNNNENEEVLGKLPRPNRQGVSTPNTNGAVKNSPGGSNRKLATKDLPILI